MLRRAFGRLFSRDDSGRRLRVALGVIAFFGLLLFAAHNGRALFALVDRITVAAGNRLGTRLRQNHGIVAHYSFDENLPREWAGGATADVFGLKRRRGVHGSGRKFSGKPDCGLSPAGIRWDTAISRDGGSVTCWIKFPDVSREQTLFSFLRRDSGFSLVMRGGRLEAQVVSDIGEEVVVACEGIERGKFSHIAIVFAPRRLSLYLNGREQDSSDFSGSLNMPRRLIELKADASYPFCGELDDFTVWSRVLAADEISRLSSSSRSVLFLREPLYASLYVAGVGFRRLLGVSLRVIDRLKTPFSSFGASRPSIPVACLFMSGADERHFIHAHEDSLASGCRLKSAADHRRISVCITGHYECAEAWLDDVYGESRPSLRPSYVVASVSGFMAPGSGFARLYPPESYGFNHPDGFALLPRCHDSLVRLYLDGDYKGIYCLEPFDRVGSAWLFDGRRSAARSMSIFSSAVPGPADRSVSADDEADALRMREEVASVIRADPRFPWSRAETLHMERLHARRRKAENFASRGIVAGDFLGENSAVYFITRDLDLSTIGTNANWHSSFPSVISSDGKVSRPNGDLPVFVTMTATFADGVVREFMFRVMPTSPRLPVFMLHINRVVDKSLRSDFTCQYFPSGGLPPRWLCGTGGTGGGLCHRGNTSYVKSAKRPISLEFDRPVADIADGYSGEHLYFFSGYADPTRLRNKFAFDFFKAMSSAGGIHIAPSISWAEVFVNGDYAGVWEMSGRINDVLSGDSTLFKARMPGNLLTTVSAATVEQKMPRVGQADKIGEFLDLAKFTALSGAAELTCGFPERFDFFNFADFLLLINLTGNTDGLSVNQYIARDPASGKWFFIPWDYDKTFIRSGRAISWLEMPLSSRLRSCDPKFADSLAARWRTLRSGPLSDTAIENWIDEQSSRIAPYMPEEFSLVPPEGWSGEYAEAVEELRQGIRERLEFLDKRFSVELH